MKLGLDDCSCVGNISNYLCKETEGCSNGTCSGIILVEGVEAVKIGPHGR
jgi:hypothetical protein